MEYPKLNSLYKREGCGPYDEKRNRYVSDLEMKPRKSALIIGEYACDEFAAIHTWTVTEKVDGTNIRIIFDRDRPGLVGFHGRTINSSIPTLLLAYLQETFTWEKIDKVFMGATKVILFGEGSGGKIQARGCYSKCANFILFDVVIDEWWMERYNVENIAQTLEIPVVNLLDNSNGTNVWNRDQIVDFVKSKPKSNIAEVQELEMEGIVARSYPLMMFRKRPVLSEDPLIHADYHIPIMFKLKCKDFE